MKFLDREQTNEPAGWPEFVEDKLPDAHAFLQKAEEFEQLPLDDDVRQDGFKKYAPGVLPKVRGKPDFPTLWTTYKAVKDTLDDWQSGKCAYCEKLINARRSQQVEHFQPKSLFPSLTYAWYNYFLACGGCNGIKSNKWPDNGQYVRPDENEPETLFSFDVKGTVKAVDDDEEVQQTIDHFGLDRRGLRRARKVAIETIVSDIQDLIDAGIPTAIMKTLVERKLNRIEAPGIPYSVALSQNVRRFWNETFPDEEV